MRLHTDAWPGLLRLGWPVTATLLVRVTMRTVDIIVVGQVVGAAGVAALGIGDAAARLVLFTALGLGAGTIATVSQALGAGDRHLAHAATTQSAVLAVAVGVPFTVLGLVVAPAFFDLLGASAEVADIGSTYLRIVILSAVPRMLAILLTRAFQGAGDTRTPLVLRSVGTGLNIALTILLVVGVGPFPRLGVAGAAIATSIGNLTSAVLLVVALRVGRPALGFARGALWAPEVLRRIVRVGAPQVLERNLYGIAALPLNAIVLTFGTAANAGFQVGRRVMLYGLLPARGVATATSTYVGQAVGGRRPDAGEHQARGGLALGTLIALAAAIPVFVLARPLAGLFLQQPDALDAATAWVRVHAAVTVLRGTFGVLRAAMQAANETVLPLYASALGLGLFTLGFSSLVGLALGAGVAGVYAGVLLDPLVRTTVLYRWFTTGRWLRRVAS